MQPREVETITEARTTAPRGVEATVGETQLPLFPVYAPLLELSEVRLGVQLPQVVPAQKHMVK